MVGNSRRGASVFVTTARTPTFLASSSTWGVAYIEYNPIGTEGSSWEISLASGVQTIHHWHCEIKDDEVGDECLVFCTASRPSKASSQTCQLGFASRNDRRVRRIILLSSAIRMRRGICEPSSLPEV
jgi:hypothetical protein